MKRLCRLSAISSILLVSVLGFQGCVFTVGTPPPPHRHKPPAPRLLTQAEIAEVATRIAHQRGYHQFQIEEIEQEDGPHWEVEIEGWAGSRRGKLELWLDGWDGRVLKIKDKRKHPRHAHGHGHQG